jgi:hypothetical protein
MDDPSCMKTRFDPVMLYSNSLQMGLGPRKVAQGARLPALHVRKEDQLKLGLWTSGLLQAPSSAGNHHTQGGPWHSREQQQSTNCHALGAYQRKRSLM